MDGLTHDDLRHLAGELSGPCLSVYCPVTPGRADVNRTRLRSVARRASERLANAVDEAAAGSTGLTK